MGCVSKITFADNFPLSNKIPGQVSTRVHARGQITQNPREWKLHQHTQMGVLKFHAQQLIQSSFGPILQHRKCNVNTT